MSDERQASEQALDLVGAFNDACRQRERTMYALDRSRQQEAASRADWLSSSNALTSYIAALEADRALLEAACGYYVAADFAYPQYEGCTCLILALPEGERAGADLRKTLSSSPLAPTQEGA